MNNYDKMKELIQKNKLQEALLLAFSNSLKLKITTKSKADEHQEIKTVINLLKGISNRISDPNLMNNQINNNSKAIDIVNFHEQQKESAYELWHKNRETIVGILQIISGLPIEINTSKKVEKKVISIKKKQENNLEEFEEEFNLEQNEQNDNFEVEENPLEDDNWVNGIVDDIVGETEEEIISEEEKEYFSQEEIISEEENSLEENWDDFATEEDNEAEVIINAQEEENWDEFMDSDYSEDSIVNSNGASPDNSSEEEEWQEWLEEESPLEEDSIVNENEVVVNESSNLEVGDEWQEWLEDENNSENNIAMEEDMDEIDWGSEDWEEQSTPNS